MHGGKSLAGAASPNYKHGRRSKYNIDRLLARALAQPPVDLSALFADVDLSDLLADLQPVDLDSLCGELPDLLIDLLP